MGSLILFTGKGGVGKSTVSAGTAVHFASQGYRTILVSSDPAHSTDDTLGVAIGHKSRQLAPNLWAKNINAEDNAKDFVSQLNEGLTAVWSKVIPGFDPELFSDAAMFPGMDEYFALEEILHLVQSPDYDVVVFDTAPTGHTLKALNAPTAIKAFILRILRMRAKIENLKGMWVKKGPTSQVIKMLEEVCVKIERLAEVLRLPEFVSINIVSIPTEAGLQEAHRTIQYLHRMDLKVNNLIINNIIPNFGDDVWETANQNPAAELTWKTYEMQQPYLTKYREIAKENDLHLVGISQLPFEPRAETLPTFANLMWKDKDKGIQFSPKKTVSEEVLDDGTRYRVLIPFAKSSTWDNTRYKYADFNFGGDFDGWYAVSVSPDLQDKKPTIRKNQHSVTLTYKGDE